MLERRASVDAVAARRMTWPFSIDTESDPCWYETRCAARRVGTEATPEAASAGTLAHKSPRPSTCRRESPARIENESPVCRGARSLQREGVTAGPATAAERRALPVCGGTEGSTGDNLAEVLAFDDALRPGDLAPHQPGDRHSRRGTRRRCQDLPPLVVHRYPDPPPGSAPAAPAPAGSGPGDRGCA